jgi:outer membrane receptor protein involved in Fe transport
MKAWWLGVAAPVVLYAVVASATIFGNVRGIVHDPQHRPIQSAQVTIRARGSSWSATAQTNADGEFEVGAVPVGEYTITVSAPGFSSTQVPLEVASGSAPILHFALALATVTQAVEVSATPQTINTESAPSQTLVNREQIARTPGADRTNSLAMITDYVPGAYLVHDQLHLRGGHQVTWLVDGVPVPNTNIASNVGPQFDPKDVDYFEIQRGGYSAEYGDRTYGVFNVVTRSGFERNNEAEVVASYGSFHQSNEQVSFGSHSERFAYYASLNGNRVDLGLATPTSAVLHDMQSGLGGFSSLIFNATPNDQLRLVSSLRNDHYQIPNTPEQQAAGIRDLDRERDAFVNFSWVHTVSPGILLTVSPFYHFNRADYAGGPGDTPIIVNNQRGSHYVGAQATLEVVEGKHHASLGLEAFAQHDRTEFGLEATPVATLSEPRKGGWSDPLAGRGVSSVTADGGGLALHQQLAPWGNLEAAFLEDQYKPTPWLALTGGIRLTHYSGFLSENTADPRAGAALRLPRLGWVLRAFYGRYYQAPPLDTVSGPLLNLALQQGFGFLPLRGERDEQRQFGLIVPIRNWELDVDNFLTHAHNFFDHDVLGNSNIFLPLTIQGARIHGWDATLLSPRLLGIVQIHLAYSHQYAQGQGGVSGGLTDFSPPRQGYFFLDHDQRDTLSAVASWTLPHRAWATLVVARGSGFLNGDGPQHLPAHTTADASLGKSFGEKWSVALTALNVGNRRYLTDNSNTFGGTHYANPREFAVELRYHFRY